MRRTSDSDRYEVEFINVAWGPMCLLVIPSRARESNRQPRNISASPAMSHHHWYAP